MKWVAVVVEVVVGGIVLERRVNLSRSIIVEVRPGWNVDRGIETVSFSEHHPYLFFLGFVGV